MEVLQVSTCTCTSVNNNHYHVHVHVRVSIKTCSLSILSFLDFNCSSEINGLQINNNN